MTNDIGMTFTKEGYKRLLDLALHSGYEFLAFDSEERFDKKQVCLLRHDIDTDIESALEIAKIEANLGIRSTYFVMLRSPVYNLMGRANHSIVQNILSLGHWLGLHYDEGFYPDNRYTVEEWVYCEAEVLKKMFGVSIKAVSFHQPSQNVLSGNIKLRDFINTYDKQDLPYFYYVSDTNKTWKSNSPDKIFNEVLHLKVHLLIHPMWWCNNTPDLSQESIWEKVLLSNWYRSQKQLVETERNYGNPRRFLIVRE